MRANERVVITKEKYLNALRNGPYVQTFGTLRNSGTESYCAEGVLIAESDNYYFELDEQGEYVARCDSGGIVLGWLGWLDWHQIPLWAAELYDLGMLRIQAMNDLGMTFAEIADEIEGWEVGA